MSTVTIQRRQRNKGVTYPVYYKNPFSGKKEYYRTFPRFKEAQQAKNDLRALLDAGKLPKKKKLALNPLTFKKTGESLREEWKGKLARGDLKEKTYTDYCYSLGVLYRIFGHKLHCQITRDEVEIFRNTLAEKHTKVTSNRYLFIIKQVFKHGLVLNAVIENHVDGIQYLSEKDHERKEFLLPQKLDQVIDASGQTRAKHYLPAIICLGAEHGASKQEILSLEWKDIDFDYAGRGLIKLYRTKNKKERVEFLMPRTKTTLMSWEEHLERKRKKQNITEVKSNRVFCKMDGTPLKSFKTAWKASLKTAGITNFHFHDLRHTFCSNLLLSGASLKDVKEMIGHSDISITDRYSHLTNTHKSHIQAQLADHYMNGANPESGSHEGHKGLLERKRPPLKTA